MKNKNVVDPILSSKPPFSLLVFASLLLLAGVFISPELLIYLGPLRKSLTAGNELIRNTTLIEVETFRVACVILFVLVTCIVIMWKKLLQSKAVIQITKCVEVEPACQGTSNSVFNLSLLMGVIGIAVGFIYVAVGDLIFQAQTLKEINAEDGLIEQATAILFLSCSIISIMVAINSSIKNRRIIYGILAIGFFLFCGEEISWGQRIFGLETSQLIKNINVQNENNIHNLLGYSADHLFVAGVFFYGVVLPVMRSAYPFWNRLFRKLNLPIPSIGLAIGFLLISFLHDWTVYALLPATSLRIAELRELMSALAFLMLLRESTKSAPPRLPKMTGIDNGLFGRVIGQKMSTSKTPPRDQKEPELSEG